MRGITVGRAYRTTKKCVEFINEVCGGIDFKTVSHRDNRFGLMAHQVKNYSAISRVAEDEISQLL
jgi:hypothetical protein